MRITTISFLGRLAISGARVAAATGIRRLPMVANSILRLPLARSRWLAGRKLGGLARRTRVIGGGIVLFAITMSGCSRHPGSKASAAASQPVRPGAPAAVRTASARPRHRLAVFGVVDGASKSPGFGYRVAVLLPGGHHHSPEPSALTNAAGMFALNGELRPGKYTFEITKGRVILVSAPPGVWPSFERMFHPF